MADRKISDLTALTTPATGDLLPIVDVSEAAAADKNKKITVQELFKGVPDGTAAAPGLAFESDDGNGIYLAGTDTIAISTGGTQRLSVNASGVVTIAGDLQVEGSTTTIESTTVTIDDKNIELGSVASPSNTTADGGGITLKGASDKTLNWVNSTGAWTSSERFDFPAGTAAAPSVILNGDVNSGIYQPGADQVAISTAGSARLYIAADGDIGVGTVSPSSKLEIDRAFKVKTVNTTTIADERGLTVYNNQSDGLVDTTLVYGGATTSYLAVGHHDGTSYSERLRIDSSGRLGIGTSSPGTDGYSSYDNLVIANSDHCGITIKSPNNKFCGINFSDTAGSLVGYIAYEHSSDKLYFGNAGSGHSAFDSSGNLGVGTTSPSTLLHTHATSADNELRIATTTSGNPIVSFHANGAGAHEIGFDRTDLALYFKTVGSSERMRINSSGFVGIGTTSPSKSLHIYSAADTGIRLQNSTTGTGSTDGILFEAGGSDGLIWNYESGNLRFATANNERARIDSSGRLLIGATSAPLADDNAPLQLVRSATGPKLIFARNDTSVAAGEEIGVLRFYGNDADGTYQNCAQISVEADLDHGTNDKPTRMLFYTAADGASSPTERVRIESNGRAKFSNSAYGVERTATASAFDLATGNFWTCGAIAIPNPTNQVAGLLGSLRVTAAPTSFAANWKHPGGTYTAPTSFPAVAPFFVQASGTILLGSWTEGIA